MYLNLLTDLLTFIECPISQNAISKVITSIQCRQIKYHKRNKNLIRILFTNGKSIPNLRKSQNCQNTTKHLIEFTHMQNTSENSLHSKEVVVN